MKKIETVNIPKEQYDRLVESQKFLDALETCGVDNWEGYSEAWNYMHNGDDE